LRKRRKVGKARVEGRDSVVGKGIESGGERGEKREMGKRMGKTEKENMDVRRRG
jgi:hypothetical protein